MSLYSIVHFVFGEYVFKTDEKNFPRLVNLLSKEKLGFWNVKNKNKEVIFRTSIFFAEEIVNLSRQYHIPLDMVKQNGVPFLFSRYRRRYGLIVGFAFGLFLMFFSQMFIWQIEISGNVKMTTKEIQHALADCGISEGGFIPVIDTKQKSNMLLINCPDLSSAAISIDGTHLKVSVLERTPLPDIIQRDGFYNVVALRDGVILDADAVDGTPQVSEGDVVAQGQLLISSFIEGKNGTFRPTHASGIVYAAVREEFKTEIPLKQSIKKHTGKVQTKRSYEILGWEIPFISNLKSDYEYFDALSVDKNLKMFGFVKLPIKEYKVIYSEYYPDTEIISPERALMIAENEFDDFLDDLDLEVLESSYEFSHDKEKDVCTFNANALIKQNIAREVPLEIQNISDKLPKPRE